MLVSWTDKDGRTHTGSRDGRAYKRHQAEQAKAEKPAEPVDAVESVLAPTVPYPEPVPALAEEPAAVAETSPTEPRKRTR